MTTIKAILSKKADDEPVPSDWCYVYNFKDTDVPLAISFAPGMASLFHKDMDELIKTLRIEIPKIFESKEYEKQKSQTIEVFQQKQKEFFSTLDEDAKSKGFSIRKSVSGLMVVPIKKTGEPLTEEEYEALDETIKAKIDEIGKTLQERLNDVVREVRDAEKNLKILLANLERDAALSVVGQQRGRRLAYLRQELHPIGLDRARSRNRELGTEASEGRFESERIEFHRRVRDGYLALAAADPFRWRIVAAERDLDAIEARVADLLADLFPCLDVEGFEDAP